MSGPGLCGLYVVGGRYDSFRRHGLESGVRERVSGRHCERSTVLFRSARRIGVCKPLRIAKKIHATALGKRPLRISTGEPIEMVHVHLQQFQHPEPKGGRLWA